MFGYNTREAVRVKVKKYEGKLQPEKRKFSVDPQITSLEVLQSILTKAFDVKSEFSISYKSIDEYGNDVYLPLLSDWDLDAAFLKAHNISVTLKCEPCMQLKVDMKPFAETTEDWEHSGTMNVQTKNHSTNFIAAGQTERRQHVQTGLPGIIMTQMEKTFNMVTRALNLYDDPTLPPRAPLCDAEFRTFLDPVGHIIHSSKLREVIYCGGIDPSLRKVVWKHILNVYPEGMTGKERMDYIKRKAAEYYTLRSYWKECIQKGKVSGELAYVTSMVRKDVLRTDRHHKFYAGSDDNQNIASLFNMLTTYALNHPSVSYCQGMSDLASPLLVTMGDEAHAYICLCALMSRLHPNFQLDGEAMTSKFAHLTESLQVYDPEFYIYLKSQQADDLLFCYRWLLLEMKREFAFEDALRMLEVLWASLPPKPPDGELALKEKEFDPNVISCHEASEYAPAGASPSVKVPRENVYTKVCAIRRQSSAFGLVNIAIATATHKLSSSKQINHSLDENVGRKSINYISLRRSKEYQSLDDSALHRTKQDSTIKSKCHQKDMHIHAASIRSADVSRENKEKLSEILKQLHLNDMKVLSSSTGDLNNGKVAKFASNNHCVIGNHIKDLRQKLPSGNKFFSSLDKLDCNTLGNDKDNEDGKSKGKMIKNLNEFFTIINSNKKREPLQLKPYKSIRTMSPNVVEKANIWQNYSVTLSRTSLVDEQDLSIIKAAANNKNTTKKIDKQNLEFNDNNSSPDDSQEYYPMTTSMTRELRLESEHLDRQVFGVHYSEPFCNDTPSQSTSLEVKPNTDCNCENFKKDLQISELSNTPTEVISADKPFKKNIAKKTSKSFEDVYLWENPIHKKLSNSVVLPAIASFPHTPDEQAELDSDTGEIFEECFGKKSVTPIRLLRNVQSKELHNGSQQTDTNISQTELDLSETCSQISTETARTGVGFFSSMSRELESARKTSELVSSKPSSNLQSITTTINNFQKRYDTVGSSNVECNSGEASHSLAGDNPFLMFLCLSVLLQHRDYIMRNRMDYNELAMHFDKMVRKHNVNRVLNQARTMYSAYLKHRLKPDVANAT